MVQAVLLLHLLVVRLLLFRPPGRLQVPPLFLGESIEDLGLAQAKTVSSLQGQIKVSTPTGTASARNTTPSHPLEGASGSCGLAMCK